MPERTPSQLLEKIEHEAAHDQHAGNQAYYAEERSHAADCCTGSAEPRSEIPGQFVSGNQDMTCQAPATVTNRTAPNNRRRLDGPMRYRLPADWEAFGARFGRDGLLYLAEWRRGFTVHELRALFFECQQVRTLKAEARQLMRDLDMVTAERDELARRVEFYRRQLILEARLGMALLRIMA